VWKKGLCVVESVKNQVCQKEFFALLQVLSEILSLCNKRFTSDRSFFFSSLREGSKIFFQSFQSFERVFVVAFVFKMSSFKWSP